MKRRTRGAVAAALLLGSLLSPSFTQAQVLPAPSILNFQGRLTKPDGTPVPDGTYSIRLSLHDAATGGNEKWNQPLSNLQVRNGTFAVALSGFPANAFHGDLWLEIKIGNDAALTPRQQLVSVAYAMKANSVPDGSIGANSLADGAVTGAKIANGALDSLLNPLAWLLGGNSGTNPGTHFLGTTDNQSLAFRTNNGNVGIGTNDPQAKLHVRGGNLQLDANAELFLADNGQIRSMDNNHRILFRRAENKIELREYGDLIFSPGATAGTETAKVVMLANGNVGIGTMAPSFLLQVNGTARVSTLAFPDGTSMSSAATSGWSMMGNGGTNPSTHFLGTTDNQPFSLRVNNRRAMQYQYVENATARFINVLGGADINVIGAGIVGATIAGGGRDNFSVAAEPNQVLSDFGAIGGGLNNIITSSSVVGTIAGGMNNRVAGIYATVGGGVNNTASGSDDTVAGGWNNTASGYLSTVGGGSHNAATQLMATVGGGGSNAANGSASTVAGGQYNTASGGGATTPGGQFNTAAGILSFAAGWKAKANHDGTFVWGDYTDADFASTGANQFLIRASGGVGINANNPSGATLRVNGGVNNVGVFAGDLAPFGQAAFESNRSNSTPWHLQLANNGNNVFYVDGAGRPHGTGGYVNLSDARYKTNIAPIENALDAILQLRGVAFDWDREKWKDRGFPAERQMGFLAQEVEKVLPMLVSTDKDGVKSVAYTDAVPVLVEAIKQQQKQIEALKAIKEENAELKARLAAIEQALAELKVKSK